MKLIGSLILLMSVSGVLAQVEILSRREAPIELECRLEGGQGVPRLCVGELSEGESILRPTPHKPAAG